MTINTINFQSTLNPIDDVYDYAVDYYAFAQKQQFSARWMNGNVADEAFFADAETENYVKDMLVDLGAEDVA